ncbi:MAG: hypothetical protein MI685_07570 [Chlorobiales bacterium]|nr:hypothetical protein [Chlorobiales bacterium]
MQNRIKRRKEFEAKIVDLEASLDNLKRQLRQGVTEGHQKDIDHLEDYLDEISHRYTNLRDFWQIVRRELKDLLARKNTER